MSFTSFQKRFDKKAAFARFQGARIAFLSDLASALQSGAPLLKAIAESAERCEDKLQLRVYRDIRDELNRGGVLTTVLGSWFKQEERMLVESFLESARTNADIGKGLENLVGVIRPHELMREAQLKTIVILVFVFFACLGAIGLTGATMIHMEGLLPTEKWPPVVLAFVAAFRWLLSYALFIVIVLVAMPYVVYWILANWTGPMRKRWDASLPGLTVYRKLHGSMVMISLGAFAAAGRSIGDTCRLLSVNATPWLRSYLITIQTRAKDQEGARIVEVGLFDWRQMVRVACLCSGQSLPVALRVVGLDSSASVAQDTAQLLQRVQAVSLLFIPISLLSCLALVGLMFSALIISFKTL